MCSARCRTLLGVLSRAFSREDALSDVRKWQPPHIALAHTGLPGMLRWFLRDTERVRSRGSGHIVEPLGGAWAEQLPHILPG